MTAPAGTPPITDAVGRTYASPVPYGVSREKVREFADALGDPHPAYREPDVAGRLGHPDVVAPPTFAIVVTFGLLDTMLADPTLGLSLSRVIHADQKFVHSRPIHAGDRLSAELSIARARPMGDTDLVMTRTQVTADGAPVAEVAATIVHKRAGDASDDAGSAAIDAERPGSPESGITQSGIAQSGIAPADATAESTPASGDADLAVPRPADLTAGAELPALRVPIRRADLVRYAGASGDFNPIHWSDRIARGVGLPGVIAHGMLTMGLAGRVVTDWLGDPGRVVEYSTRFTEPVHVPEDDHGVRLDVHGTVGALLDDQRVRLDLDAAVAGEPVLGRARAIVQL